MHKIAGKMHPCKQSDAPDAWIVEERRGDLACFRMRLEKKASREKRWAIQKLCGAGASKERPTRALRVTTARSVSTGVCSSRTCVRASHTARAYVREAF